MNIWSFWNVTTIAGFWLERFFGGMPKLVSFLAAEMARSRYAEALSSSVSFACGSTRLGPAKPRDMPVFSEWSSEEKPPLTVSHPLLLSIVF